MTVEPMIFVQAVIVGSLAMGVVAFLAWLMDRMDERRLRGDQTS